MTKVDFYILADGAPGNRYTVACRLAEKAWQQGRRVFIHTPSLEESRHMDRLLWTWRDAGFVPHGLYPEADPALNPVLIGHSGDPGEEHDVLINLHPEVPPFFSRFERLLEPIDHDETARKAGRGRWGFYKARGYPLESHNLAN
jgi:DNA polymerase III subunit chi